jgi:dTDP-4-dehydrorhamnose reductase
MKVLVTGAGGMTGAELVRQSREKGWTVNAYSKDDLDITEASEVDGVIARDKPDVIFNAAAYTAVDAAEGAPEIAMAVNAAGPANVARAANIHGISVVHISTDYVFDGESSTPYKPDDRVGPINVYGESKLAGEIAVRDECERHVIVRTSWVFSHQGKNFVRTMLRAADEGRELRVVNDQHGRPTSSADLASALVHVAEHVRTAPVTGTFHYCNTGCTTWYDFAHAIFELRGKSIPAITPVPTSEFPTAAKRPRWSVLDTSSFEATFGITPRSWRDSLKDVLEKIA